MKIYTRQGDDGRTHILGGACVWKDDPRVRLGGSVDELFSWLGVVIAHAPVERPELAAQLRQLQGELFTVGAVAQLQGHVEQVPFSRSIGPKECARLEQWIDALDAELPTLERFILPGGCPTAAFVHVARTVCRRAECDLVALARSADAEGAPALGHTVAYLNRLSDFLFVLARFLNHIANVEECLTGKG